MNEADNGIDLRTSPQPSTSREIAAGSIDELPPGQRRLAFIDGRMIVLFNIGGTIHAIDDSCPHNGASLASGKLSGGFLQCPAHGLRFDLATGCMPGGGGLQAKTFPVRVVDGRVRVVVDDSRAGLVSAACGADKRNCASAGRADAHP